MRCTQSNVSHVLRASLIWAFMVGLIGTAQAASISGWVFNDSDADGDSTGETGRSGVTVRLWDVGDDNTGGTADDSIARADVTDASGEYTFALLSNGTYYVVFAAPSGMAFTWQNAVADNIDSDADVSGWTETITVSGSNIENVDAGLVVAASLGDYVWEDDDADGIQDEGESGLAGVTVRLYTATDTLMATTTTAASGAYSFASIIAGTYYIKVTLPAGYLVSPKQQGGDTALDSDLTIATAESDDVTLAAGDENDRIDAGLYTTADVSGLAWYDTDGDGYRDPAEPAQAAVVVRLYDPGDDGAVGGAGGDADTELDDTTTDATGVYSFADLAPDAYYVRFEAPAGMDFSSLHADPDDTRDSDADPANGCTSVFALVSSTDVENLDAGVATFYTVGDLAWVDTDEDGVKDGGEAGAADVLVLLYSPGADGLLGGDDDELMRQTSTAANGTYSLAATAGDYYLHFLAPAGYTLTGQDQGRDDTTDSDPDTGTGLTALFAVAANDATRDVGLLVDTDGDGTADSADGCPEDWYKTAAGDCGCGVRDTDSDADGVADCLDNCPDTYNPGQADSDNDGVGNLCEEADDPDDPNSTDDDDNTPPDDDANRPIDPNVPGPFPNCGTCGPIGLASYTLTVLGYGAILIRRRR